jgi:hypothetical protein
VLVGEGGRGVFVGVGGAEVTVGVSGTGLGLGKEVAVTSSLVGVDSVAGSSSVESTLHDDKLSSASSRSTTIILLSMIYLLQK